MSEYTEYLRSRVRVYCDGCGLMSLSEARDGYYPSYEYSDVLADECGWQVWAGRNRRHYCPDCNPKPGHRMRLVRGDER